MEVCVGEVGEGDPNSCAFYDVNLDLAEVFAEMRVRIYLATDF